jgi:hypothetical protein
VLARELHEPMRRALEEAQWLEAHVRRDGSPFRAEHQPERQARARVARLA